jgi:hypothetical protein
MAVLCDSHSKNANLLAWTDSVADQRGVGGQTGAEHGRNKFSLQTIGNWKGEVLVGSDMRRVAAVGDGAIWVDRSICIYCL